MNPALYAPIYPPSLHYPSLHFTTLLDDLNTFTFPSVHHMIFPLNRWLFKNDGFKTGIPQLTYVFPSK
jgi:hypothetical protein